MKTCQKLVVWMGTLILALASTSMPAHAGAPNLVARMWNKEWNSNPFAGGCKSRYTIGFTIPPGAILHSVGIATSGKKCWDMQPFDTPAGANLSSTWGGVRMDSRPPVGTGPGNYVADVHWWFNQWGDTQSSLCVWVDGAGPTAVPPIEGISTDHSRSQPHPFPFCFGGASVSAGVNWNPYFQPTGPAGGVKVDGFHWRSPGTPCYVMWPGCTK